MKSTLAADSEAPVRTLSTPHATQKAGSARHDKSKSIRHLFGIFTVPNSGGPCPFDRKPLPVTTQLETSLAPGSIKDSKWILVESNSMTACRNSTNRDLGKVRVPIDADSMTTSLWLRLN